MDITLSRRRAVWLLALLVSGPALARPVTVTVFAAASLSDAIQRIGARFQEETGVEVRYSFAASSALARQIEAGANAEVFFSADADWMDYLEQRKLTRPGTRYNALGNRLALVAPADSTVRLRIAHGFPLREALGRGRLATGDPDAVPVGRYARAALTSLGVWDSVADRLVRADNVRGALMFVARGEAPFGIVYATDARIDPKVRVVDLFPTDSHPPIIYPVALTASARPPASRFLDYLRGAQARDVFTSLGFVMLMP